ncbi:MAG: DMT family transporter [Burkholderiales bacterium]|nr:DMT family transporter [Burkholderiales bacterium]
MRAGGEFGVGLAAALTAVLVWGALMPVAKDAYRAMDAITLTAVRYAIAAAVLAAILFWREGGAAFAPGPRPAALVVAGALGMAGSPLLVFFGLAYTLPEHAVIIVALQPSMTALAQWFLHGRRPPPFTIGAILVAFAGVVTVVVGHGWTPGDPKLYGDLLVLSGALCWMSYTLMLDRFPGFGVVRFTTLTCLIGLCFIVAATLAVHGLGLGRLPARADLLGVTPHILFLAVPGVVLAMLVWNYGNARIGPLNSLLLINLMPVETYFIRFLQGAQFSAAEWVGGALVVGALVANNLHQRVALRAPG